MKLPLTFLLLLSPFAVSCGGVSPPTAPAPAVLAQWSGVQGGAAQASTRVVRTAADWRSLWQQVGREVPRPLDPEKEMGVVVFLGERNTGGYTVDVANVRIQAGRFIVEYRETAPAPDALTTQALTYPWAFALVPRSELPVVWQNLTPAPGSGTGRSQPAPPRAGARQER